MGDGVMRSMAGVGNDASCGIWTIPVENVHSDVRDPMGPEVVGVVERRTAPIGCNLANIADGPQ